MGAPLERLEQGRGEMARSDEMGFERRAEGRGNGKE